MGFRQINNMYYLKQTQNTIETSNIRRISTDSLGESVAINYLHKHGYKILEKNWSCRWGEINLIAIKNEIIYFYEIKTRGSKNSESPFEAISFYKRRDLYRSIHYYLKSLEFPTTDWTVDLLGIELQGKNYKLYHWENILEV